VIRDLPRDGVVREAGAYRIPLAHYHTQAVCPGPSISSSGLRTIYIKSPADFWVHSELNPERFPSEPSDAKLFGRAAHALLLGDEAFDEAFYLISDDAPPRPTKAQIKAREKGRVSDSADARFRFWDEVDMISAGRELVPSSWYTTIGHMSQALAKHPLVGPLFDGDPEVSLIWQDVPTGIWLKSRMDMHPRMGGVRADLKTCTDASLRAVMREIGKYGYDMQAALGDVGSEIVLGETIESNVLVFVEKTPAFNVTPVEITETAIHFAKLKNRKAINTFARCLERNEWPGKVEGIPSYDTPEWEQHEIGEAQSRGEFPRSFFEPAGANGDVSEEETP
jgi:hypothetical protein